MNIPPRITPEEEYEIFQNWNRENRNRLIEGNISLAMYVRNKFRNTGADKEELLSTAFVGLVKAANTFDVDKGYKFSTYAAKCMETEILYYLRRTKKQKAEVPIEAQVFRKNGEKPIVLQDMIPDAKAFVEITYMEDREQIKVLKQCLSDKEEELLRMWESEMKQNEIANVLGISQSFVSRKLKKIFEKMRRSEECSIRETL